MGYIALGTVQGQGASGRWWGVPPDPGEEGAVGWGWVGWGWGGYAPSAGLTVALSVRPSERVVSYSTSYDILLAPPLALSWPIAWFPGGCGVRVGGRVPVVRYARPLLPPPLQHQGRSGAP